MRRLSARVVLAFALGAVAALGAVVGVAGSAAGPSDTDPVTARAVAIQILVPGANPAATELVTAPPASAPLATSVFA
jgi:hypothetical protein